MSEDIAQMNQRKRKLDFVPDAENKRRRSDEAERQTMKQRRQSSSNTIDQYGESDSEDDPSELELSSGTETSSDSGISSSDSNDEEEDEDEDSKHHSSSGDATSNRDSLGDDSNMISLPTQPKPAISTSTNMSSSSDLQSRIATFLPQLRKANEDLEKMEDDHRIDAVADDQDHYIEMDLGLGVLKEKPRPRPLKGEIRTRESSSSSSSSVSSSDGDSKTDGPGQDAMRDLLGKEKGKRQGRPVIQHLNET